MEQEKVTAQAEGVVREGALDWYGEQALLEGYEIHMGRTTLGPGAKSLFRLRRKGGDAWHDDGAVSPDGRVIGTYLHGIFDNDGFRAALLARHRAGETHAPRRSFRERKEEGYDRLAELLRRHLDIPAILRILDEGV
jgi:adenosylcobyric acid synthase